MEINKKLNIDNDLEFLNSGDVAHACGVVVNNTNEGFMNEHNLERRYTLPNKGEKVVGFVSCADEFVLFTNLNHIFRYNEALKSQVEVNTNWKWQGGKVIGAYTYNINKELIIGITEIGADEDVPLKIINLDKPDYIVGQSDDKYTINPVIPQYNLVNYSTVNGNSMYRGVYNFFIRFKKGDEYTAWYRLGYPIILHDASYSFNAEDYVYNKRVSSEARYRINRYILKDTVNNDVDKVNKNIVLGIAITDTTHLYDSYQIGYIANTVVGEIKIFNTPDYNINTKRVTITGNNPSDNFSLDDLTSTAFNLYNVKTLCNYNNRLYIANYKEENSNIDVPNIDVSDIKVKAVTLTSDTNAISQQIETGVRKTLSDAVPVTQSAPVATTNIAYGSKYVVKIKCKIHTTKTSTVEVTKLFYTGDTTYVSNYGNSINVNLLTILNACFANIRIEINGRPESSSSGVNITQLRVYNNDGVLAVKFAESVNNTTMRNDFELTLKETNDVIVYDSSDFTIQELYKVDIGDSNPAQYWFCQPVVTVEEAAALIQITAPNIYLTVPFETNGKSYNGIPTIYAGNGDSYINGYKFVYNCKNTPLYYYYTDFNVDDYLESRYPGSTRKYKFKYVLASDVSELTDDSVLNLDYYSSSVKTNVKAIYNCATNKFELYTTAVNANNYSGPTAKCYQLVEDVVTIDTANDEIALFDVTSLSDIFTVDVPNSTKTVIDFNNTYGVTYQWSSDREANNEDFNPNLLYGITYYGKNYSQKTLVVDVAPTTVGFRNVITGGNVITIDKDFALMIPFKDWFNNINVTKCTGNENYTLTKGNYLGSTVDKGLVSQLYIAFLKDTKQRINNVDNYTAYLVKVNDTSNLMNVKLLLEYTEVQYNLRINDLVASPTWVDVQYPVFNAPVDSVYNNGESGHDTDFYGDITKQAINNAVYNFFIHYVYPNGTYTDGIQIVNDEDYSETILVAEATVNGVVTQLNYTVTEDTKIADIKVKYTEWLTLYKTLSTSKSHPVVKIFDDVSDVRFCNVFPKYNVDGIALYKNSNGDKLFRGSLNGNAYNKQYNHGFKFVFENIKMYPQFVGYFISYEKSEPILTGECMLTGQGAGLSVAGETGDAVKTKLNAYYPEFDLAKTAYGNILYVEKKERFDVDYDDTVFKDAYYSQDNGEFDLPTSDYISSIKKLNVYAPNDTTNNRGRQGILAIECTNGLNVLNSTTKYEKRVNFGLILNIADDLYIKKSKELISLGYIKYVDYAADGSYDYGYESYNYNYDYYKVSNQIFDLNRRGVNYDEINPAAKTNDGTFYNKEFPDANYSPSIAYHCPIVGVRMTSYSLYPTFAKNIKTKPVSKYYNFKNMDSDTANITTTLVTHLYYNTINDLYELKPNYYDYADKLITNYDEDTYSNFITDYDKTIRRSDVISNESVENRWKKFRTEQYKIITENKGAIINIVGIGGYLIAHCEHSMFIFNRDSSMKTEDKDVQLVIPDVFDINYVEMFTSTKGYAGIQHGNQFVCSNYGYIFYDSDAHKVYRFNENSLDEITPGMKALFNGNINDVNFVIDEANERLICIGDINIDSTNRKFAVSYSFNVNNWISHHAYYFELCFNTKNNVYFIYSLDNPNTVVAFGTGYNSIIGTQANTNDKNYFHLELLNNIPMSYVDVVFNNANIDKVLEYITYNFNYNSEYEIYSGNRLMIYNGSTYTGNVDISKPKQTMTDYKSPRYKYGKWVFNWFRNISKHDDICAVVRSTGKPMSVVTNDTINDIKDALMVGKVFVVRICFVKTDLRISLNDVQCYMK